ncbi:helix-turn-helix domain-containing protein [Phytoactinopolyspora limicola]|uniref:helix-turn-helix domain-containing protein n=1 Tax=Phytoactinopolyspora limicola TaxID=2715536 RepID=UPI00140BBAB9|nr:helix-turn-helix domain-containing protein [Phytoactinopolyspora limicola]
MTTATQPPRPPQQPAPTASTKGLLNPLATSRHVDLRRYPASSQTGQFVERYWSVRWDVPAGETYEVQLIPHPCVNITFLPGAGGQVHGVGTRSWSRPLTGSGYVIGVKLRPGGFTAITGIAAATVTDRWVPLRDVFGPAVDDVAEEILTAPDDHSRVEFCDEFLRNRLPPADQGYQLVLDMVATMLGSRTITKVSQVAELHGCSIRSVQRLFQRYVGVGPKWVIRRYRLHDAAEMLAADDTIDATTMAVELGWFDQAHFIRDFNHVVGMTPGEYAAACAAGRDHVTRVPRASEPDE